MSLMNEAKMPRLKDKLDALAEQVEKEKEKLEKKDEKVSVIIKKSAKKN